MDYDIHRTPWETYHPAPGFAWTVYDAGNTDDTAPSCHQCGRCDCASYDLATGRCADQGDETCEGLSFAYVNADGRVLCQPCGDDAGLRIVPCDCPNTTDAPQNAH
jgi:hypothetical protein